MVIPGSWGCEGQVFGMLLGRQVCRFYYPRCSCKPLARLCTWQSPWGSLSPPPWCPCAGTELCWEPAPSAAGAARAGRPAGSSQRPLPGSTGLLGPRREERAAPHRLLTWLPPLCSGASLEAGFGAKVTCPHHPAESWQPGVNPCTCHSRRHRVLAALVRQPSQAGLAQTSVLAAAIRTQGNGPHRGSQGTEPGCERCYGPMTQSQPRLLGTEGDLVSLWLPPVGFAHHLAATTGLSTWL